MILAFHRPNSAAEDARVNAKISADDVLPLIFPSWPV